MFVFRNREYGCRQPDVLVKQETLLATLNFHENRLPVYTGGYSPAARFSSSPTTLNLSSRAL